MRFERITTLFVVIPALTPGQAVFWGATHNFNESLKAFKAWRYILAQIDQNACCTPFQYRLQGRSRQHDR